MRISDKKHIRKTVFFCLMAVLLFVAGCAPQSSSSAQSNGSTQSNGTTQSNSTTQSTGTTQSSGYTQIDQETAKEMMEKDDGHIIVDVRRQDEYDSGHIPGAILIPNESISTAQPEALPDLDQIILVYCRSGRRSKEAAQKLADIGYKNVYEFGGIIDWTGETVMGGENA